MGTRYFYQGKGIMRLFLTQDYQKWDITPDIKVIFESGVIRLLSNVPSNNSLVTSIQANIGEVFDVCESISNTPTIVRVILPEHRGEKILWALGFSETQKRSNSEMEFYSRQEQLASEKPDHCLIVHTEESNFAFCVSKKRTPKGNGHKNTHQANYKSCHAWCANSISESSLKTLIQKVKRYKKIYCPIEFILSL